jgi:hypothetical protein
VSGSYDTFARRIVEGGVISDPWIDGEPRFREEPIVLERTQLDAMYRAAEEVTAVYDELCVIVGETPALLDDFFGLTPFQKAMWTWPRPLWHGIARADVFVTDEGLSLRRAQLRHAHGRGRGRELERARRRGLDRARRPQRARSARFVAMVEALTERLVGEGLDASPRAWASSTRPSSPKTSRWCGSTALARGARPRGGARLSLQPRARRRAARDALRPALLDHARAALQDRLVGRARGRGTTTTIPDAEPLASPLAPRWAPSSTAHRVLNPFGAVLPQNKRAMAFMWEHMHRFSPRAQETIERLVPLHRAGRVLHGEQLLAQREAWVLKSDYGAEGDEVIVGRDVTDELWRASLAQASRGRWIAQRYFEAKRSASGEVMNHGVFLVAGEASGIYARTSTGPTDDHALSVPVLVREG